MLASCADSRKLILLAENMKLDNVNASTPFPLAFATAGMTVTLLEIRAGQKLRKRLSDLGLAIGMQVRVVKGGGQGPMILAVAHDARLALGHGMAQKIMVQHIQEDIS